jgi:HK97 family phage portal protein
MGWLDRLMGAKPTSMRVAPNFGSARASGEGVTFTGLDDPRLVEFIRGGLMTHSGAVVTERTALCISTAWRCASIICGVVATLPCDLMLRESESARSPAVKHPFRDVLTVKPNNRQTPGEFKRMLQLHKLHRGNGYAMKIVSRGRIIALWPLDPNRMQVTENADLTLTYRYTRKDGSQVVFQQSELLHLRGLSWDGVEGLPVIRYMAEALGLGIQTRKAAAKLFKNGQFRPGYIKGPTAMSDQAYERLKKSIDESAGIDAEDAQKTAILEEGFEFQAGAMTANDAQLIEIMGFSRDDIGAFYGVPPHLYGDTEKSTSWGTGIEQQNIGFLQYTIQDHLTGWSETVKRDCLNAEGDDARLYMHFDLKGFLRADAAGRSAYLARALGGGGSRPWMTQNEARAAEDLPKRNETWADTLPEVGNTRLTISQTDPNAPAVDPATGETQ